MILLLLSFSLVLSTRFIKKDLYEIQILPFFYFSIIFYTFISCYVFNFGYRVPYEFYGKISLSYLDHALMVYAFATFSFYIGANMPFLLKKTWFLESNIYRIKSITQGNTKINFRFPLIISVISPLFFISANGLGPLFYRSGYVVQDHSQLLMAVSDITLPFSAMALAFVKSRYVRYLVYSISFFALFGLTTRSLVLYHLIFYLTSYFAFKRTGYVFHILNIILVLLLLGLVLQLRVNDYQGFYGHVLYIVDNGLDFSYLIYSINYVFTYSTILLGYMIQSISIDEKIFFAQINPLPSFLFSVEDVAKYARVRVNIPYAAIGEVYIFGSYMLSFFFYSTFGLVVSFVVKNKGYFKMHYWTLIVGFVIAFTVFSTQYNLRTPMRFFYYFSIPSIIYIFLRRFKIRLS